MKEKLDAQLRDSEQAEQASRAKVVAKVHSQHS
jgi:hypothetical protein